MIPQRTRHSSIQQRGSPLDLRPRIGEDLIQSRLGHHLPSSRESNNLFSAPSYTAPWPPSQVPLPQPQQPLGEYALSPEPPQLRVLGQPPPYGQQSPPEEQLDQTPETNTFRLDDLEVPLPGEALPPYESTDRRLRIGASPGYDPVQKCSAATLDTFLDIYQLYHATTGKRCDEHNLVRVFANPKYRDPWAMSQLVGDYNASLTRDLIQDIKSPTHGEFQTALCALIRGPLGNDVHNLKKTLRNLTFDEPLVMSILLGRSNADIWAIKKEYYRATHGHGIGTDVMTDSNVQRRQMYEMALRANRLEETTPILPSDICQKVEDIQDACVSKDENKLLRVSSILMTASSAQLRAMTDAYQAKFQRSLVDVLSKDFGTGKMGDLVGTRNVGALFGASNMGGFLRQMLTIAKLPAVTAKDLHISLQQRKDRLFISKVMRLWWSGESIQDVVESYYQMYDITLQDDLQARLRGPYRALMMALVSGML